jgi:hydroxypyruvate isomerase
MAGVVPPGVDPEACTATFVANLQHAAAALAPHGITLLIEAINTRDIPGYYLNFQHQAHQILGQVAAPNLKMQMDCYHMQIMEGDISTKLQTYAPNCGHVQIAGVPGRHEPDNGEIHYPFLFELLDKIGFTGWVGCEYRPAGRTLDGLGWFAPWKTPLR